MKVFICHRSIDNAEANKVIEKLFQHSENSIAVLRETNHDNNWKKNVEEKFKDVDFVLFLIGSDTFDSIQLKWEYAKAKELNKRIIGVKLSNATKESILYCQAFQVFDNAKQSLPFLKKKFEEDQKLKLEQYKIMVGSTEKVTDQRLKVNNLFFTVTSSILSIGFILGKAFEFSVFGFTGMLIMTIMAFLVTFFWSRLIKSYGKLNSGKFRVIDKVEKQLRSNMFDDEWQILKEIGYEPNSKTEIKIIIRFRFFIFILIIFQIGYICFKYNKILSICN